MQKTDTQSLNQLKELFKNKWGIDLNINEDLFSFTDCWFTWKDKVYQVEVKRRRFKKDTYPTTIINLSKYNTLVKGNDILVIMFDDCWGICKDVKSAYLKTSPFYARSTTDFGGDYKWSDKVELDLDKFQWYEY